MKRLSAILDELGRRKVLRVVGIYLALFVGFVATVVSIVPVFNVELSVFKWPIIVGAVLIPVIAVLSWRYNIVPPQLVRDPKDVSISNPALGWAAARHDAKDAGFILIVWRTSESGGHEKRFFQPVTIGREPANDIELPDPRVSRFHAVIWAEDGVWRVRDLDSANGTFVDNARVSGSATLPQACEVRFHPNGPTIAVTVTKSPETMIG